MNHMVFGNTLSRLRKRKKLTQSALADQLNISDKSVSKWETGAGYPDITLLPQLAHILGTTVDYMLTGERRGIAIAGNIITDVIKDIDAYPAIGMLANVTQVNKAVGGCAPNTAIDLSTIDPSLPISVIGSVGDDEYGRYMLGWDITDFGQGDFDKIGFSLITIRNGNRAMLDKYPKVYAEKLLYLKEGQMACNHFHWYKTEDIINRGGGNCLIRVYNSLPNEEIDYESDVVIHKDGLEMVVSAGTQIRLCPGESLFVTQCMYHDFQVESGTGPVLLGEVSQCNDDNTDNRFHPPVGRFPEIEEDEAPYRLLCNEYPKA